MLFLLKFESIPFLFPKSSSEEAVTEIVQSFQSSFRSTYLSLWLTEETTRVGNVPLSFIAPLFLASFHSDLFSSSFSLFAETSPPLGSKLAVVFIFHIKLLSCYLLPTQVLLSETRLFIIPKFYTCIKYTTTYACISSNLFYTFNILY